MIIYDYFKDIGNTGIVFFSILTAVTVIAIIILIFFSIKTFLTLPKSEWLDKAIGQLLISVVLIVALTVGFIPQTKEIFQMKNEYKNGCPTIVGNLNNVTVNYFSYGRADTYNAIFTVGEGSPEFIINSEKPVAYLVKAYEGKKVKVWYSEKFRLQKSEEDDEATAIEAYKIELID